jgi:hypothetical protein
MNAFNTRFHNQNQAVQTQESAAPIPTNKPKLHASTFRAIYIAISKPNIGGGRKTGFRHHDVPQEAPVSSHQSLPNRHIAFALP